MRKSNILPRFVLTAAMALTSLSALADEKVTNPISAFEVTVDGAFTGGLVGGKVQGEWSDVTPVGFIAPVGPEGRAQSVPLGTPGLNSLVYGAIAPGAVAEGPELYLMYDYTGRRNSVFNPNLGPLGEFVASIAFPVTIGETTFKNASVDVFFGFEKPVVNTLSSIENPPPGPGFNFFLNKGDGSQSLTADFFNIEGAVGFGASTLTSDPHLLIELEVPLLIPKEFGGVFGNEGHSGVYSPDPQFWGGTAASDEVDPPISSAIFTIHPNGSTTVNAVTLGSPVPDGLPLGFSAGTIAGLLLLGARTRRTASV